MQACLMFNDYVVADEDGNTIEAQKILAVYLATAIRLLSRQHLRHRRLHLKNFSIPKR